jgi:hypothetical protein
MCGCLTTDTSVSLVGGDNGLLYLVSGYTALQSVAVSHVNMNGGRRNPATCGVSAVAMVKTLKKIVEIPQNSV